MTMTEIGSGASAGLDTQTMVEMLKQILGVDVQIAQAEGDVLRRDRPGQTPDVEPGWIMDYPDPEDIVDLLFYSTSRQNNSKYNNPAFDKLMKQARTEPDTTKRMQLYQQAENMLMQDMPWVPLYFGQAATWSSPM